MDYNVPKFVKWAGGKSQLLRQLAPLFPKSFNNYFEPFVGGGAMFFFVKQNFSPKKIFVSDINDELMITYKVIKSDYERLLVELKQHKEYHLVEGKKYYLTIRETDPNKLPFLERAARFIYLNKTCFNGLYRVNSSGEFNVPMGAYKNPSIIQEERIRLASKLLGGVSIRTTSFEKIIGLVKKNDFVYLDPPYYPIKKGASFTSYTKNDFLEDDQKKLAKVFSQLDKKGCFVMQSNSDTKFIESLYSGYNIHLVRANRMINCDGANRKKINELVITNY